MAGLRLTMRRETCRVPRPCACRTCRTPRPCACRVLSHASAALVERRSLLGGRCSTLAGAAARWWSTIDARWTRDAVRCRAKKFEVAAVGRPPLRRVSDDVLTAGLISSRVWFGLVPGSP
ncbi:hypothetical protein F511_46184 [Dorcoceras hygrometricum]|uniref:Uncharacterized protein n=1 Tax=Dorcoceras hygrometricum TaxID=472368 RepID=A0A2Z6ZVA3_9LAMI|nr:hypothetical protein F511_46184 [Dorcoceras hygrometricum]